MLKTSSVTCNEFNLLQDVVKSVKLNCCILVILRSSKRTLWKLVVAQWFFDCPKQLLWRFQVWMHYKQYCHQQCLWIVESQAWRLFQHSYHILYQLLRLQLIGHIISKFNDPTSPSGSTQIWRVLRTYFSSRGIIIFCSHSWWSHTMIICLRLSQVK